MLCVIAGASRTHSVCVCSTHQIFRLLGNAMPKKTSYKALLKLIVCDVKIRERIMRQYIHCPDDSKLKTFYGKDLMIFY